MMWLICYAQELTPTLEGNKKQHVESESCLHILFCVFTKFYVG